MNRKTAMAERSPKTLSFGLGLSTTCLVGLLTPAVVHAAEERPTATPVASGSRTPTTEIASQVSAMLSEGRCPEAIQTLLTTNATQQDRHVMIWLCRAYQQCGLAKDAVAACQAVQAGKELFPEEEIKEAERYLARIDSSSPVNRQADAGATCYPAATDAYAGHVWRARSLLGNFPNEALRELDAAAAIRQEPPLLYLRGLAQQSLGLDVSALVLFRHFIREAGGQNCAAEVADANLRIAKLRSKIVAAAPLTSTADRLLSAPSPEKPRALYDRGSAIKNTGIGLLGIGAVVTLAAGAAVGSLALSYSGRPSHDTMVGATAGLVLGALGPVLIVLGIPVTIAGSYEMQRAKKLFPAVGE